MYADSCYSTVGKDARDHSPLPAISPDDDVLGGMGISAFSQHQRAGNEAKDPRNFKGMRVRQAARPVDSLAAIELHAAAPATVQQRGVTLHNSPTEAPTRSIV